MTSLAGRVALVTGASRGIGLAVAAALQQSGARVARIARSLHSGAVAGGLDVACDLTDAGAVDAMAREITDALGTPDLIVNNAGSFLLAPIERTAPQEFAGQLAVNLTAPFLVVRAFLAAMRERGSGRIITIGSIADHRVFAGNAAYAAAKFGVRGLHGVLREELSGSGVLCTLISPGPTDTAVWDPVDPDSREGFVPRSRMLRPEDVAEAVHWVATRPARIDIDRLLLGPA